MTPAEEIARWADKLRGLSAIGLHFSQNVYDAYFDGAPWDPLE